MRKILVVNPKGGCGKTTIATNLASYYAVWGVSTALIDCDPQHSTLDWLKQRPENYEPIRAVKGGPNTLHVPRGVQRVVIDAPARTSINQVDHLVQAANAVLIPVLPSPIDIRAAAHFIGELLLERRIKNKQIGVLANRVRENTVIYTELEKFLKSLGIPFVTHLRDTQNYIRAAGKGIGIFEMAPSAVDQDIEQWRPLIRWVEGKKKR